MRRPSLVAIETEHHFGRDPVIVVSSDRWHEGVVGIVAMRIVEKFYRPAFAISSREGVELSAGI